jgi:lipopolysaccharide transport system permease protein
MLAIFGALGHWPGSALLWLPLLTVVNVALAIGLGLTLGVLNVFMRDIEQVVPVAMQFLYWFTPIVYMPNVIPAQYQDWLLLNPLIAIVGGYQNALLFNKMPDWFALGSAALLALVLMAISLLLFRKAGPEMVDQL